MNLEQQKALALARGRRRRMEGQNSPSSAQSSAYTVALQAGSKASQSLSGGPGVPPERTWMDDFLGAADY